MAIDTRCLDYRPANVYKREIRLLEISTGRDINDPISARLVGVRVTPDLEFVGLCALLRENPSDASTEDVWVNGCRIPVPATIGQALRAVRALFRRDQGSLYQTQSNSSSSTTLTSSRRGAPKPPPSPTPPPPTSTPAYQQRAAANAAAANANATVTTTTTTTTSTSNSNSNGGKKTPRWLRQLLRGFRSILPDDSSSSRNGGHGGGSNAPLRVFVDCLCMDLRNEREAEQRRAVLQLAYGSAQITVGWLGEKDETSDVAIHILRALDEVYPPGFGTPEDRLEHPENYSPVMKWLEPIGAAWAEDGRVNGDPEKGPLYVAATKYLSRPFFQRGCECFFFLFGSSLPIGGGVRFGCSLAAPTWTRIHGGVNVPAQVLGSNLSPIPSRLKLTKLDRDHRRANAVEIPGLSPGR